MDKPDPLYEKKILAHRRSFHLNHRESASFLTVLSAVAVRVKTKFGGDKRAVV